MDDKERDCSTCTSVACEYCDYYPVYRQFIIYQRSAEEDDE